MDDAIRKLRVFREKSEDRVWMRKLAIYFSKELCFHVVVAEEKTP